MQILIIDTNECYYYGLITKDKIEEYQNMIGGYVEIINLKHGFQMVVDEEGKLKNLPYNALATYLSFLFGIKQVIVGKVFIIGKKESIIELKKHLDYMYE